MQSNVTSKSRLPLRHKTILTLLGIIFVVIVIEITLRLGGLIFSSLQEYHNRAAIYKNGAYRIMCLGESTTVVGGRDSYPSQLEEILNQRNIGIKFSVINKGVPIVNTSYILAHLEENLKQYQPDMVTAMMGNNDSCVKYYVDIPEADTALFNKFKTYKFLRILWINLMNKIRGKAFPTSPASKKDAKLEAIFSIFKLKESYAQQINYNTTEESLKQDIEINPKNDGEYVKWGLIFKRRGENIRAEECFKKATELNPRNYRAHLELGYIYNDQRKYTQAEEVFKKAIGLNPQDEKGYIELSLLYHLQGKFDQSADTLRKVININPRNDMAYMMLGMDYVMMREYAQVEDYFKKAIALNPNNDMAYFQLGKLYMYQQKFLQAEQMYKKAIELNPQSQACSNLILMYEIQGKNEAVQEYAKKLDRLREKYDNPVTRTNYRELKSILDQRQIKLVCIQYPMLSVEPLRKIFEGQQGAIFVDNEKIFKDALKNGNFKEYFIDMFAGEFGHCTRKGNRLIAENIANVILKECFNKYN